MDTHAELDRMPRGNTAPGVNRSIIEYLLKTRGRDSKASVLDVPYGKGEFLDSVNVMFPNFSTFGVDIAPSGESGHRIIAADLSDAGQLEFELKFDLITSISGVMEFDNTLSFLKRLREYIADDGQLIVSNDNLLSARDRLLYFLTGRFRQYPMFVDKHAPTWKILPLQNLLRILEDSGFEIGEIRYVPVRSTEWLWLPLALPIYLAQALSFLLAKGPVFKEKAARYPFASLFSRHYFVICRPNRINR